MIIWISSYPRSGNTLLRTILKQCMGVESLDEHVDLDKNLSIKNRFLEKSRFSQDKCLIKTHDIHDVDDKVIYIIRDGRLAIYSYYKWLMKHFPWEEKKLIEVIFGADIYPNWSEHVNGWLNRSSGKTLLLRYNDLVNANRSTLDEIAKFIGHHGEINDFRNNYGADLRGTKSEFIGGKFFWNGEDEWGEDENHLFKTLHGKTMNRVGFSMLDNDLNINEIKNAELYKALTLRFRMLYNKLEASDNYCKYLKQKNSGSLASFFRKIM